MKLKDRIELLMKKNGIDNLHQLALLTNIPYTTLRSITNNSDIRISSAKKLSKCLNVSLDELLKDER